MSLATRGEISTLGQMSGSSSTARPRLAVIDYGMGNLRSVVKAWEHVGADAYLAGEPEAVGDADAVSGGFWQRAYFSNFGATIGGGTTQVQANIVAEHVLGLPK